MKNPITEALFVGAILLCVAAFATSTNFKAISPYGTASNIRPTNGRILLKDSIFVHPIRISQQGSNALAAIGGFWSYLVPAAPTMAAPVVSTDPATGITATAAVLNATANPNGSATTGWFRYGTTSPGVCNDTFGTRAPTSGGASLGSGMTPQPFAQTISGLSSGTTYYFCSIAQNNDGLSFGAVRTFTTTIQPPVVSTSSATLLTSTSAQLNATANPNGLSTTGWFRYSTVSPGTCNDTFGTRAPASGGSNLGSGTIAQLFAQAISGLSPATTYFFCPAAQNQDGIAFGAVASFTTAAVLPSVATNPATNVSATAATLNGEANPNGSATTGWFRYSTTDPGTCNDSFGSRAPTSGGSSLGSGTFVQAYSRSILDLLPGTTYYYCAIASNVEGLSFGSLLSFTTASLSPTVSTNAATLVTRTSAQLNGTANPNGVTTTGWFRYSTTSPGTCNDSFGTRAPASGGSDLGSGTTAQAFAQSINGLNSGTTYYYCAIAQNAEGVSYGSVLSFTTTISSPIVSTNAATLVSGTSAQLNGSANPNGTATTGWFRYSTTSPGICNDTFGIRAPASGGSSLGSGTTPQPFAQAISGLSTGTTYYYCAIAQNPDGISFGSAALFSTASNISCPGSDRVWDGGGTTNNWSEAANWCNDQVPPAGAAVRFNATSTKNVNIDVSPSTGGFIIEAGYTGTITVGAGNTLTAGTTGGQFEQYGGTFNAGAGNFTQQFGAVVVSGGTFNGGSGTLTIPSLSLSGGLFDAGSSTHNAGSIVMTGGQIVFTSGTMTITNSFFRSGGTGDFDNGTIIAAGGLNQALEGIYGSVNDLTINKSDAVGISTLGTVNVLGTLSLIDGIINGSGTLEARGPVVIASTFGNSSSGGGGGTIAFHNGSGPRAVTLPVGSRLPALVVDDAQVQVNTDGPGTINLDDVTLNAGSVEIGVTDLIVGYTTAVQGSAYNQTGGSFNISTGNIVWNTAGNFTMSNGTFNAGSGSVELGGGQFNLSGGTFTPSTGSNTFGLSLNTSFNQSGGIFASGAGTVDVNGVFNLSGGTFNAPAGNMFVGFNFTHTAGTFNHNQGTLIFDSSHPAFGHNLPGNPGTGQFHNLVFALTTDNASVTLGDDTWVASGDITISNGQVAFGILRPERNFTVGAGADGGDARVSFTGSAAQTFQNNGGTNPTGTFTVDKISGTVTAASDLLLGTSQALNITSGTLYLNDGSDMRAGNVTIGTNGRLVNDTQATITLGGNIVNSGRIDLRGGGSACPGDDLILIRSSVPGTQRNWSGSGAFRLVDVDVQDMAGTAAITAYSSTNSGNNGANISFNSGCPTELSISPISASVYRNQSQTFTAGGGLAPRVFSLLQNNSGGLINSSTGLYTAGNTSGVIDTIRVTDAFGDAAIATVNVIPGPATRLAFRTQPSNAEVGTVISPPIQVAVQDDQGNTVPNMTNSVTLTLVNNPGGATLAGTVTRDAINGIATFNDISLNVPGVGYTIAAEASGLTADLSSSFEITGNLIVTNTNESGPGSLRSAIEEANATPGAQFIAFNIPGPGPHRITINNSSLPAITGAAVVDGRTQPGYAGTPVIEVASTVGRCLELSGEGSIVRGLAVSACNGEGILLGGTGSHRVLGNYIGTNIAGTASLGQMPIGISVISARNEIGGEVPGEGNVIAPSHLTLPSHGIRVVDRPLTTIKGNFISVNALGNAWLGTQNGITLDNADFTTIGGAGASRNLITASVVGISLVSRNQNVAIKGNYIGTDANGEFALLPAQYRPTAIGIFNNSFSNSFDIEIGGAGPGEGNLVSGYADCILLAGAQTEVRDVAVRGNKIGTNAAGTSSIGCIRGVTLVANSAQTVRRIAIGGSMAGEGNLISGNHFGISFRLATSIQEAIDVIGNKIGVDSSGTTPLPNRIGIYIENTGSTPNAVRIGGIGPGEANIIARNDETGVALEYGARNISIRGNSVYGNQWGFPGPEPHEPIDHLDPDPGSNDRQNYPTITNAFSAPGSTSISGSLNSRPSRTYAVDLYGADTCTRASWNDQLWGQGKTYLGSTNVTVGSAGIAAFTFGISSQTTEPYIVATATDPEGNTSPFSPCVRVGQFPVAIEGTVLDSTGRPVENAVVEMSGDVSRRRRTDSNGVYRFLNLPSGGSYSTRVTASGFGISPATRDYPNLGSSQTGQDFTATRGRYSIRGATVTTADGATLPLSGVRMTLSGTEARGVVSEGEFQIANLPPGTYTLTPFKGGVFFSPPSADITITDSDVSNIVFSGTVADRLPGRFIAVDPGTLKLKSLHADGTNRGLMVNAAPVARQRVSISRDGRKVLFAKTDLSGRKLSQVFTSGSDGANETRLTDEGACEVPFEWSPDGTKILFGLCEQSGRQAQLEDIWVMNADGSGRQMVDLGGRRSLSGASWIDNDTILFVAATGSQGTEADFITINLDGSNETRITDDSAQERDPIVSPDGSRVAYYLRIVEPSGRIRAAYKIRNLQTGVVTDLADSYAVGKPAWSPSGSHLAIPARGGSSTAATILRVFRLSDMSQQDVDEDGSAWFSWGPNLSFQTQSGTNVNVASGFVSVTFGGVGTSGTTTISPISPSSAGTAPNGFVLGGLAFEINTTASYTSPVTVCFNVPDTFATSPVSFSKLALLHNEGGVLVDRTVSRDFGTRIICGSVSTLSPFVLGAEVDSSLPSIEGVAVDSESRPMSNVLVSIFGDENAAVETDVNGRFSFVNLPAGGNFLVQPKKVGYLFADYNVDVIGAAGTTDLAFVGTEAVFTATGRVVNQNGNGVPGVAMSITGSQEATTVTGPNGEFALSDLPADGDLVIQPADPNYPISPAFVDISPLVTDATGIEFVFLAPTSAGVSLSGRVVSLDGFAIANAVVTVIDSNGRSRTARTGSFGNYFFEGLEAGETYVLSANAKGHAFTGRVVTVNEDLFDIDLVSATAGQVRTP